MPSLRPIRLLNAVEAGTVTGMQLQALLTDAGRNSEFSVLVSSRGQSRRIANSPVTMTAITTSQAAIDTVFKSATKETSAACQAVVAVAGAMSTVANSTPSLDTLAANPVSWGFFRGSAHYETNVRTVVARLARVDPGLYPTIGAIIADPVAMVKVAESGVAMAAAVASRPTMAIIAATNAAFIDVAANTVAIDLVAKETAIMDLVAGSTTAMDAIVTRISAMRSIASYPGAIKAVAATGSDPLGTVVPVRAWSKYMKSSHFSTNLATALANMIGVNPLQFDTLDKIIASASALGLVAGDKSAVEALASNSAAMSTLAVSPNLGIILSSSSAMGVIGPDTGAMTSFLNSSGAWVGLFGSSVAKGFIVASTPLVSVIAGNSALITYLKTLAKTITERDLPDGNATSLQVFPLVPAKLLMLHAIETGIAATVSNYNFGGTPMTGSTSGATLALTGAVGAPPTVHVAGYTNLTWNFQGIGVTAATVPVITYVDMT